MAKAKGPSMPSKAHMAKEDRQYRAEAMVRDAMKEMPQYKAACKAAERQMMKAETAVKQMMKKGK